MWQRKFLIPGSTVASSRNPSQFNDLYMRAIISGLILFSLKYNFPENDNAFHISEFSSLLECVSFPGRDGLKSNIVNDDGCKDPMK